MNCVRNISVTTLVRVFAANISNHTEGERIWFSLARMWPKHFQPKTL